MDPGIKTELNTISKGQIRKNDCIRFLYGNRNQVAMYWKHFPGNSISENLFKILNLIAVMIFFGIKTAPLTLIFML